MIRELIYKRYGVKLSRTSVCRLLGQLGLAAQRPLGRAYQQNPEVVQEWIDEEYPKVRRQVRRVGPEI